MFQLYKDKAGKHRFRLKAKMEKILFHHKLMHLEQHA